MGSTPPPARRTRGAIDSNLIVSLGLALLSGLGGVTVGIARGAWSVNDRVTTLETTYRKDVEQRRDERDAEQRWRARLEDKVDRLLERAR